MGKIRYGLKNVHVAFYNTSSSSYESPIKLPGAVNMELDPVGDKSTFYADDQPYAEAQSNGGYSGSLEIAVAPDEFLTKALGFWKDKNGALVEDIDGKYAPFALMFEVSGNEDEQRTVFYNVTASRPKISASTKQDGLEAKTVEFEFTAGAQEISGKSLIKATLTSGSTGFDNFMTSVYKPVATSGLDS